MNNDEIISSLVEKSDQFTKEYGEVMCLRANLAAINRMLIKRNRGEELLENFTNVIDIFKKRNESIKEEDENSIISPK